MSHTSQTKRQKNGLRNWFCLAICILWTVFISNLDIVYKTHSAAEFSKCHFWAISGAQTKVTAIVLGWQMFVFPKDNSLTCRITLNCENLWWTDPLTSGDQSGKSNINVLKQPETPANTTKTLPATHTKNEESGKKKLSLNLFLCFFVCCHLFRLKSHENLVSNYFCISHNIWTLMSKCATVKVLGKGVIFVEHSSRICRPWQNILLSWRTPSHKTCFHALNRCKVWLVVIRLNVKSIVSNSEVCV